jgi:hypothetical protein
VIEGAGAVNFVEVGEKVHHGDVDGEALLPAAATVSGSKVKTGPEGFDRVAAVFHQDEDGFAHDQGDVAFEADLEPFSLVLAGIGVAGDVYPNFIAANFDREAANIVGELVEGSAAFEVEAGVVPVAGEDAVFDRSPV